MSRILFPKISPYSQEWLAVDDHHQLYVEQSGNINGTPVVYLHGGPGAGCSENYRRYFDPEKYRIILFDQRGCGRSKPSPSIEQNSIAHLVNDIEHIRQHLGIDKILLCGGSWGTTLAIAYGIAHPSKVLAFILRGIFLGTQPELDWLYQANGAAKFFPEYYQEFVDLLPEEYRENPLAGYQQLLASDNELAVAAASKAWYIWELRLSSIEHHPIDKSHISDQHQALCMAIISAHFFAQFSQTPGQYLLDSIDRIKHLPAILLHGRYDMVCQLDVAYQLAEQWQNAQLQILPCAGHSGFESQTIDAFCKATDTMAAFLDEQKQR
ncbi:prolyl aminopeptidase [Thalassotalea euphylliae]|uniref:Proline iminopeptidase n=1 Tax=Thalassotalea euphylliae TaxID=1655234 RepID=A0A3E0UBD6_9GAMM|nr:prolyl aminopeptidase [Thalassotalea euphylliae]REL34034.1 prolyl aminopeptidase [Thalassotalea euphylliae]